MAASKRRTPAPRGRLKRTRTRRLKITAAAKPAKKAAKKAPKKQSTKGLVDIRAGVEPTVRVFHGWTIERIRQAEIAADQGNFRLAADLCEWLFADDRVGGLMHTRVQSLLGLEPTFEKAGDKRRSGRAVKALDAEEDFEASYPETELTQMTAWGLMLGFAPLRHGWLQNQDNGNRLLPYPTFWHPQHVTQDTNTREWRTRIAPVNAANGVIDTVTITPGDGTWIFHTPYGTNRPWAWAMWRGLAPWVLLKHLAMHDWSRLGEKGGLLTVETQPQLLTTNASYQSTLPDREQLAQDLYDRGREGVAVLPPGYNAKLVESLADSRSLYKSQIDMANEAIAIMIRGGNLTTQVSGGSLAAAEVQERTGEDAKRRFDAQTVSKTIHDQSLVWWAQFNFGDRKLAPWPVYPVRAATDQLKKSQAFAWSMGACEKVRALGFELDRVAFADEFEMSDFLLPAQGVPNPGSAEDRAQNPNPPAAASGAGNNPSEGQTGLNTTPVIPAPTK